MRSYHIFLYSAELEVTLCIFQRCLGVGKAVQFMRFIGHMPIIQKIIVKKRTSYESPFVCLERKLIGNINASHSNGKRMLENGNFAVLNKLVLFFHSVRPQNISSVVLHNSHFICSCQFGFSFQMLLAL